LAVVTTCEVAVDCAAAGITSETAANRTTPQNDLGEIIFINFEGMVRASLAFGTAPGNLEDRVGDALGR
jgi:hypothetical protein